MKIAELTPWAKSAGRITENGESKSPNLLNIT